MDEKHQLLYKQAREKLEKEKDSAKSKASATMIIGHLIKRCGEDAGFCEDILNKDKTFTACFRFITGEAKKKAVNGCAAIRDDVVYEWAEDYYRAEGKPKPARKSAPVEEPEPIEDVTEDLPAEEETPKVEKKAKKQKPKKEEKPKDDGMSQMNIFDFLG